MSPEDFRLIAPSRYGYLGTPLPPGPSDPATQADAYASLLDSLKVSEPVVVMGVSAGALSAMQFALRHPRRVKGLILLVPASWLMTGAQEETHRQKIGGVGVISSYLLHSDFLCWLGIRAARRKMASFIGVPENLQASLTEEDARNISEILETLLPVSKRAEGLANEDKTFAEIKPYPVERIKAPTLIIDAEDVVTFPGSEFLAAHIPNAQLLRFKRGGHLLVGHGSEVREAIDEYMRQRRGALGN